MRLDSLIFGGGAAGLWLLDRLSRQGHHVLLLEANSLGHGQTVASNGIIHGEMKYNLTGQSSKSDKNTRELQKIWGEALLGRRFPDLARTRLRSTFCHLWRAESSGSRASVAGARFPGHEQLDAFDVDDRPAALSGVRGTVVRLEEQVISPRSFVQDLATQYHDRILQIDAKHGLEFDLHSPGEVAAVRLRSPRDDDNLELCPRQVIFTAGSGNSKLRKMAGLSSDVMQRRPLHMILVRGHLPVLNGHCLDGAKARVTVTSETDAEGRMVWQIGGQIAEDGVKMDSVALIERAKAELTSVLPGVDLHDVDWSTYLVDRAEGVTSNGARPDTVQVLCAGNVTTGWPTKLVLAPVLAQEIASRARTPYLSSVFDTTPFDDWPRPDVAELPWAEAGRRWWTREEKTKLQRRRVA